LTVLKPMLKSLMVSALDTIIYDEALSNFAFKLNLRRHTSGGAWAAGGRTTRWAMQVETSEHSG
jgi:hypothetical protein